MILDIREESNTAQDFCTLVTMAVSMGFLKHGDNLYENAAVNFSEDAWQKIVTLLSEANINTIPLPKYSPELNPIEKCFRGGKALPLP